MPFLAEIRMFAGNFAPRSWALCEGQILPINQNQALFSLLGTIYGGDGRTTFALPDLRGRVPISPGTGPGLPTYRLGQQGGNYQNVISVDQLPSHGHAHGLQVSQALAGESDPNGNYLGAAAVYSEDATANTSLNGLTIANTGGGQAVNNMEPYLGINYIICTQGTFPSRS